MSIPNWWQFLLLALAAWRVYVLIAFDTALDGPRNVIAGLPWGWQEHQAIPKSYRENVADFITCSHCMGWWVSIAWWGAFQWSPHWSVMLAVPWALSTALIIVHKITNDG